MTTSTDDPIIAFRTGPPYQEPGILCVDCGAPGFDEPLKRSELKQERCDWCGSKYGGTIEDIYGWLVDKLERQDRNGAMTEDEKHDLGYDDLRDPFTKELYPVTPGPRMKND